MFEDHQTVDSDATPEALYRAFARIGGQNGYYASNWAWSLRGLADKLIGGPGLRRGRRHPVDLRRGDALDFWRVVDVRAGASVGARSRDEVARQGVADVAHRTRRCVRQCAAAPRSAYFAPKGLLGRLYWYAVLPFHALIFRRMARAIADEASARVTPAALPRSARQSEHALGDLIRLVERTERAGVGDVTDSSPAREAICEPIGVAVGKDAIAGGPGDVNGCAELVEPCLSPLQQIRVVSGRDQEEPQVVPALLATPRRVPSASGLPRSSVVV